MAKIDVSLLAVKSGKVMPLELERLALLDDGNFPQEI